MNTATIEQETKRQEINLFTLEFHPNDQPYSFAFASRCCLLLFVALMIVEAYTGWSFWKDKKYLTQLSQAQQQTNTRLTTLKQSQPLSQRPKLEKQLSQLQSQVHHLQQLRKIIGGQELGNFTGFSLQLAGLARQTDKDVSLTHIHLLHGGGSLRLQGWTRKAESVPRYLQDLRKETSLRQVRFGVLDIEKDPEYKHKLRFTLGGRGDDQT